MNKTSKKVLFVLTSHAEKGNTGEKTGFFLSEAAHPWDVLVNGGYGVDFVSPKGGNPPVDGFDLKDPINKKFWEDAEYHKKVEHTMKPEEVNPKDYIAIFFVGGHGAVWDFPNNTTISNVARDIYENGGIVAGVCHGPAGMVNIKLSDGQYLIHGKKVTGFTNEEEKAVKAEHIVPFLLETKMIERGGKFEKKGLWADFVVSDQRVITGQNPQSATSVGKEILKELELNK